MLELMAMSYVVSVCLYLGRQYPTFPKLPVKQLPENAEPITSMVEYDNKLYVTTKDAMYTND